MSPAGPIPVLIETVLLETDVPDLVLARDIVGAQYLCCFVERREDGDRFLAVPISVERLSRLRQGDIDLREALAAPETGRHYDGRFRRVEGRPTIHLEPLDTVPQDWLPEQGFWLNQFAGPVDDAQVIREAIAKDTAIVECHFEPVEARGATPRISADHLSEGVRVFQAVVRYAYKKKLAAMDAAQRFQFRSDGYVMQAFAFSYQSFCVHFESKYRADLVGQSPLGVAMHKVDELMALLEMRPEDQIDLLRANHGHMVSALKHLLKFVSKQSVPLAYKWAEPATQHVVSRRITPEAAAAIAAILEARDDLTEEDVTFVGHFVRVSVDLRTWQARDLEGRMRRGTVHEDTPDVLAGTVNELVQYRFDCEERLQVQRATGREKPKLFLKAVRPTAQ